MIEKLAVVFTDIVDSTLLNEQLGDATMDALWRSHDAAARELMLKWQGREIARSDGFFIVFERASNGARFADAYHRATRRLDPRMKARVGIHVGPLDVRENTDAEQGRGAPRFEAYGIALPIAARVMSAARGHQTLLTAPAAAEAELDDCMLRSCGHWRLKGVADPVELFAWSGDGSPLLEPPGDSEKAYRVVKTVDGWAPAREIAHSLPADRDRFVGRLDELAAITDAFDGSARLVTLLGIGGIGKTRLALRYAHTFLGDYPGGAWFCDLAAARSVDGVVQAVAQGLDMALGRGDPVAQIAAGIDGRGACLVILDNFEQLTRHARSTLGVWLTSAPRARFLVTSREVLGIAGEHTLAVAPMPPDEGGELFRLRARAAIGRGDHDSDRHVEPLVKLLDGLPLAIELAAARTRVMTPAMLLERMNARFTLLASRGGRIDRQATLRATLDWSWDLLTDAERQTLAQLSVFEGGFTLDAAEGGIDVSQAVDAPLAVDVLQSLVEKSLVRRGEGGRFQLLGMVQEYGAERLHAIARECAARAADVRHFVYYTTHVAEERSLYAIDEMDNLLGACRNAIARGAGNEAAVALEVAWAGLKIQGPATAALELASMVRERTASSTTDTLLRLHRVCGSAHFALGQIERAQREWQTGLDLAKASGDRTGEAQFNAYLGDLHANASRTDEAARCLDAALAVARTAGAKELECSVHNSLGSLYQALGQLDASGRHFEAGLAVAKALQHRRWVAGSLGNLAQLHATKGNHREAEALLHEAVAIARVLHDRRWEGNALCNLGLTCQALGKLSDAQLHLDRALTIARHLGNRRLEAVTLCNLGIVADALGEAENARAAYERAIDVARALGDRRSEGQFLTYLGLLDLKENDHAAACARLATAEALLEAVSDRLSLGHALSCRAQAELLAGDAAAARLTLARAESIASSMRPEADSEFGAALARARDVIC